MAKFVSSLEVLELVAQLAENKSEDANAVDLKQFVQGDAERGVGNILDCYM